MSLAEKLKDFVGLPNYGLKESEYQEELQAEHDQASRTERTASSSMQLVLIHLETIRSAKEIVNRISEGIPVVFSVMNTPRAQARRLLDFVCGGLYAYDGWAEHIGMDTYLLLPLGIDLICDD